ncbi:MAG: HAD family hydrolase [Thermoprotei archaeon]
MKDKIIYIDLDDTIIKNNAVSTALSEAYKKISSITNVNLDLIKQEAMSIHLEFIRNNDVRAFDWDFIVNLIAHKFRCKNNISIKDLIKKHISDAIILDNAIDVLMNLKEKHTLILATNGLYKYQRWIIETFRLKDYFDMIITSDKVGCIKTCEKFYRLPNYNSVKIMVGDHPVFDVYYPKRFGLKTILIDRGFKPSIKTYADVLGIKIETIKPDIIVKKFDDILYVITNL